MAEFIFPFSNCFCLFAPSQFRQFQGNRAARMGKTERLRKKSREKESAREVLVCAMVIRLHSKLYSNFAFISFTKGSLQFQKKMAQR